MVVKKTVAINPLMDEYIRKTWAMLIEAGYDASYSTAVNFMLLEHMLSVSEKGISKKVTEYVRSFLNDESTLDELNLEDYATRVDELFEKRNRSRQER